MASTRDFPPEEACLRFVNTVSWRGTESPVERLPTPAALLAWVVGAGVVTQDEAEGLRQDWTKIPGLAQATHDGAKALREAIADVMGPPSEGKPVPASALAQFNEILSGLPVRRRLDATGGGFAWSADPPLDAVTRVIAPLAWSAADLLVSPRMQRLRRCADTECSWLFLDESRAGNRRWCSMGDCGNRAKARRHYARKKQAAA